MSTPRNENDIDALVAMGITHVLTLTAETPLDPNWFQYKLEHVYIPIANYGAPTIEEMDNVYARMQDGGAWLVHCGGGVGRAGTILACVMAMLGTEGEESENTTPKLDAGTAIAQLRQMRPRSLESAIQEKFVSSWISHRWKQAYVNTTVEEPCTILQRQGRIPLNTPLVLFLIGKPGSGKSWLASAISKRRPRGKTMVISQDESGSRATCEREAARSYPDDTLVIFDRCNPLPADRKTWLELFSRQSVAVYFDYSGELCRKRMNNRLDHPTLRAGRGGNALEQFEREMTAPTLDEGFQAILTIGSFSASSSAIQLLTSDPPLLKFPRTPHLINLGAVTSDDVVTDVFGSSAPASGSSGGGEIQGRLTLEEKIDGANMGISLDWNRVLRVQNRSHWVSSASQAQFKKLDDWIERHSTILHNLLDKDPEYPERYILYGEWVSTKHSIRYTALPDLFIAFDLYDRLSATFLSRRLLTRALEAASRAASTGTDGDRLVIHQVPLINETECVTREELLTVLKGKGQWTDERLEGVYVRWEDDRREQTIRRGKIVRGDFIAGNEHWSKGHLTPNVLKPD
jgi:atypical dual specificity phosphatase